MLAAARLEARSTRNRIVELHASVNQKNSDDARDGH
jgi:hypothetical protein